MSESGNESDTSSVKVHNMTDDEVNQYHNIERRNHDKYDFRWQHACPIYKIDNTDKEYIYVSESRRRVAQLLSIDDWAQMGDDISEITTLIMIQLHTCGICDDKLEALFGRRGRLYNCPIDSIDLSGNVFGPVGIEAILPFLKSIPVIKWICITSANLGSAGVRLLSEAKIEQLDLQSSQIGGDFGLRHILTSRNSNMLTALDVTGIQFGRQGFEIVSNFLRRDDISLKKLYIGCNHGEYAKMIAEALLSNKCSKLELISLHSSSERSDPLKVIYKYVQKIMCDTTSFETICESNHHLHWKNPRYVLAAPDFTTLLGMNERREHGATISHILRSKLRRFYFNENFDLQPFYGIDVNLMPHLLQLVTRKEEMPGVRNFNIHHDVCDGDLSCIFRILRNINAPETFEQPKLIEMKKAEVDMLKANNTSLKADNVSLKADNVSLKADTATLKAENESLLTENESMKDMLEKLTKEIEELRCCKKHSKRVKTK